MTVETPSKTVLRLLGVLEVLYDREAAQIKAGDHRGLLKTQSRSAAVIEGIRSVDGGLAGADVRRKAERVLAMRSNNQTLIANSVDRLQGEISRVRDGRRRLAIVAPAYGVGGRSSGPRRFAARG